MVSICYFADPSDNTHATIGVDLNGYVNPGDGVGFWFSDTGVNWGDIETDITWLNGGDAPGGEQARRSHPQVEATLQLHCTFDPALADYEDLLALYRSLGSYLDSYGTIVWQPEGATIPVYIDTYPSPIPALFRGTEKQGLRVLNQLLDVGYELRIWRHPHPRRAVAALADAEAITNTSNTIALSNPGSVESEAKLTIEVPGSEQVVQAWVGIKQGVVETTGYAIGSPASVSESWTMVDREVITPSVPANLEGTYRVIACASLAADIFEVQLRWGTATNGPQGNSNDEVRLEADDVGSFPEIAIDLGTVTYDREQPRLVLEIWGRSNGGTNFGGWGRVYIVPTEGPHARLSSPGFWTGAYGREVTRPEAMDISGGVTEFTDEGAPLLDTTGDTAANYPQTLPAGHHIWGFRGHVHNSELTAVTVGEFTLIEDASEIKSRNLRTKKGHAVRRYSGDDILEIHHRVTSTSLNYSVRAEKTHADATNHIAVAAFRHRYIPIVSGGGALVTDSGRNEAFIADSNGDAIAALRATNYIRVPPGNSTLVIVVGEMPAHRYHDIAQRQAVSFPTPVVDTGTNTTVSVVVTPRELHP